MELNQTMIEYLNYVNQHYYDFVEKGNVERVVEPILKQIVNLKFEEIPISAKEILFKHAVTSKCKANGADVCKVEFKDLTNDSIKQSGTKEGKSFYSFKEVKIFFNTRFLTEEITTKQFPWYSETTSNLDRFLMIANHETEHYLQHMDTKKGVLTRRSFDQICDSIFRTYISVEPYYKHGEYMLNYKHRGMENQANVLRMV